MKLLGANEYYSTHFHLPQNHNKPRPFPHHHPRTIKASEDIEIRVCVNRTCRKQGSRETLDILSGIAPPHVSVNSCGCLSKCGAGPNLVVLPKAVLISHCGTASRAAEIMAKFSGGDLIGDPSKNLEALALRKRAEEELDKGDFAGAEVLLTQAVDLNPSGGLHIIYKSRSAARLAMGNNSAALEDAKQALTISPQYSQAYLCQGDAFLVLEDFDAADKSYAFALQLDPSIRRSKSFKTRVAKLQEKLIAADTAL